MLAVWKTEEVRRALDVAGDKAVDLDVTNVQLSGRVVEPLRANPVQVVGQRIRTEAERAFECERLNRKNEREISHLIRFPVALAKLRVEGRAVLDRQVLVHQPLETLFALKVEIGLCGALRGVRGHR